MNVIDVIQCAPLSDDSRAGIAAPALNERSAQQIAALEPAVSSSVELLANPAWNSTLGLAAGLRAGVAFVDALFPLLTSPEFVRVVVLTLEGQSCSLMVLNTKRKAGVRISEGTKAGLLEMTTGSEQELINWIGGSTTYFARSDVAGSADIVAQGYLNS